MYGDPHIFLSGLIAMGELYDGMVHFCEELDEEKLWQLYLASVMGQDCSFDEYKEKAKTAAKKERGMSKQEVNDNLALAQGILDSFNMEF